MVVVEAGLAEAPSTVAATAGAAEGVVVEGATETTGVTATTDAAEDADARFFFLPVSFFSAASAMACGSFGGGFCPANPAAT